MSHWSHCPAYALVPVWFARFAVRARSKLGVAREANTPGVGRYKMCMRHCTAYAIALVWRG